MSAPGTSTKADTRTARGSKPATVLEGEAAEEWWTDSVVGRAQDEMEAAATFPLEKNSGGGQSEGDPFDPWRPEGDRSVSMPNMVSGSTSDDAFSISAFHTAVQGDYGGSARHAERADDAAAWAEDPFSEAATGGAGRGASAWEDDPFEATGVGAMGGGRGQQLVARGGHHGGGKSEKTRPHALARMLREMWVVEAEIAFAELEFGDKIGSGGFAEVFRGTWRGEEVAIKKLLHRPGSTGAQAEADFRAEAALMTKLTHPNVVRFMGVCPSPLCLVTEFCPRGNLFDLLHNVDLALPLQRRLQMALDAARGMAFLHNHTPVIIHRDLKSLNLLVDKEWRVKVGDFGLSRFRASSSTASTASLYTAQIGTYHWMAPEVMAGHRYTEKADVFSFGIILWELWTRDTPYKGLQAMQVGMAVLHRGERPPIPDDCHEGYSQLIQACWRTDPSRRPGFHQIVPFLERLVREGSDGEAAPAAQTSPVRPSVG